jgi:hypothetical protein
MMGVKRFTNRADSAIERKTSANMSFIATDNTIAPLSAGIQLT